MKKKILLAIILIVVVIGGYACNEKYPRMHQTYEYTVVIETPDGIKTGSTVRKVGLGLRPSFLPEDSPLGKSFNGEAVVIDLGEKGLLFGLISWETYKEITKAFPYSRVLSRPETIRYYGDLEIRQKVILKKGYPRFVRFDDLNDPLSVKPVNRRDIGKTYGEGYKLKEITIEIVDKKVTRGILDILPWLPEYHNKLFDGRTIHTIKAENRLANSLGAGSFYIRKK